MFDLPEIRVGTCFLLREREDQDFHLWMVVADDGRSIVIVNVTTLRSGVDTTTLLERGEHPFIKHDSVVNFRDAKKFDKHLIPKLHALGTNKFRFQEECFPDVVQKLKTGILKSPFTSREIKRFCEEFC